MVLHSDLDMLLDLTHNRLVHNNLTSKGTPIVSFLILELLAQGSRGRNKEKDWHAKSISGPLYRQAFSQLTVSTKEGSE